MIFKVILLSILFANSLSADAILELPIVVAHVTGQPTFDYFFSLIVTATVLFIPFGLVIDVLRKS